MVHSARVLLSLLVCALLLRHGVASRGGGKGAKVAITELVVPQNPRSGEDVTLTCRFRLEGDNHRLYTVNWWRGRDQFYTYKRDSPDPKFTYNFPGIDVYKYRSNESSVVLRNVSEETSGVFKCEVMGEAPSFRTAVQTGAMNVVVLPDVDITSYAQHPGTGTHGRDVVQLNCTARGAKPKAKLSWEINGRPVASGETHEYREYEDYRGRFTTKVGLYWRAPEHYNSATVTCRARVDGVEVSDVKEVFLGPASSAAYNHQYSSAGCPASAATTLFALACLILSSAS